MNFSAPPPRPHQRCLSVRAAYDNAPLFAAAMVRRLLQHFPSRIPDAELYLIRGDGHNASTIMRKPNRPISVSCEWSSEASACLCIPHFDHGIVRAGGEGFAVRDEFTFFDWSGADPHA